MALVDRAAILQIFGSLMKHPQFLSESDKYNLTPNDFYYRFDKFIFTAIDNLYRDGAEKIQPIDVENFLNTNESAKVIFKQQNGIEYLQDAEALSDEISFPYYYKKIKKFNLLNDLANNGVDISQWYIEDASNLKAYEVNEKFEDLEISDIFNSLRQKILGVERNYVKNDTTEIQNIWEGVLDIIDSAGTTDVIGPPLQGSIFNEVCAGARKGIFLLRSAASGVGKSRSAVSDACYLAFPFRYDSTKREWIQEGSNEKVMIITTEQTAEEVQKMVLAYLTDMNETKFRYGGFTDEEQIIIKQALWILNKYQDEDKYVNGITINGICTNADIKQFSKEIQSLDIITNSFEYLLEKVDSVYIRTSQEEHYKYISEALSKGKNVLCESPIDINETRCKELLRLAKDNNCVLMETIRTAYSTAYSRLLLLIKSGKIGNVLSVDVTCTSMKSKDQQRSLYDWGANALLPVFQILGTNYKNKKIISKYSDDEKVNDIFTKIEFLYDKATASIKVAEGAKSEGELIVTGTKGYIYVPAPWWKTDYFEVRYENPEDNKRYFYQLDGEGIRYELVEFSRSVKNMAYYIRQNKEKHLYK